MHALIDLFSSQSGRRSVQLRPEDGHISSKTERVAPPSVAGAVVVVSGVAASGHALEQQPDVAPQLRGVLGKQCVRSNDRPAPKREHRERAAEEQSVRPVLVHR